MPMHRVCALFVVIFAVVASLDADAQLVQVGTIAVTQELPAPPNQGRINAIAVDPSAERHVMVVSDSGGLFESFNAARSFVHRDNLPIVFGADAQFSPLQPDVVVATGRRDFPASAAGVWVSTNGGRSWIHPAAAIASASASCAQRPSASSIAFAPDTGTIFVATDCGVSIGSPDGLTWHHVEIPQGLEAADLFYTSVAALGENRVVLGGSPGILTSSDDGANWSAATDAGTVGPIQDLHAIAANPVRKSEVYAVGSVGDAMRVYVSHDAGRTWSGLHDLPASGTCGGIAFVRVRPSDSGVNVYAGDHCGAWALRAPQSGAGFDYSGPWIALLNTHSDLRDLGFHNDNRPWFLASDGGLTATVDGTSFTWVAPPSSGLDALQVTELAGQRVNASRVDIYYGTQDNNVLGGTLPILGTAAVCCEGFFFSAERYPVSAADNKITYVKCGPCGNRIANALFGGDAAWPDPVPGQYNPKLVLHRAYVQGAPPIAGATGVRMMYTPDEGTTWRQIAAIPYDFVDIARVSGPPASPVVYQAIRTGTRADGQQIFGLARLSNVSTPTAITTYPLMHNFGSFGVVPTMFAWFKSYSIDPNDPSHLIAPDVFDDRMKVSHDGGDTWTALPALTNLVTHSGRLPFSEEFIGVLRRPLVSTIGFCPDNSARVLIGTYTGGAYLSSDRGTTWLHIPGSDGITFATSVFWEPNCGIAHMSTYGRGVWKIDTTATIPIEIPLTRFCEGACIIWDPFAKKVNPGEAVVNPGILVEFGAIYEILTAAGVTQVVVSPGATVLRSANLSKNVRVVRANLTNSKLAAMLPAQRSLGRLIRALPLVVGATFRRERLRALVLTQSTLPTLPRRPGIMGKGTRRPPTLGRPYAQVLAPSIIGGHAILMPNETLVVVTRDVRSGTALTVDGNIVARNVPSTYVRQVVAKPPGGLWRQGAHTVQLRVIGVGRKSVILDSTNFIVPAVDRREYERERR